jgi:hypothetical protein
MKSQALLPISNVVYSAPFAQSPGILTGMGSTDPYLSAFDADVSHFLFSYFDGTSIAAKCVPKFRRTQKIENLILRAGSDRIEQSAWRIAKKRLNGKW